MQSLSKFTCDTYAEILQYSNILEWAYAAPLWDSNMDTAPIDGIESDTLRDLAELWKRIMLIFFNSSVGVNLRLKVPRHRQKAVFYE